MNSTRLSFIPTGIGLTLILTVGDTWLGLVVGLGCFLIAVGMLVVKRRN